MSAIQADPSGYCRSGKLSMPLETVADTLGGSREGLYEKSESFAWMSADAGAAPVLERIRDLRKLLGKCGLTRYQERIVRQACRELLDAASAPGKSRPFRLHPYVLDELQRMPDALLPRYLFYRYRYEVFPERRILDDFPPLLQVEPTSICNYRCVFCYQTDDGFTSRAGGHMGVMPLAVFKQVVDQAQGRCEALTLASRGEPLLCQDITHMLAYAAGKFLALKINTNASPLDERKCHAILSAEVNTVVFSVDSVSGDPYARLRVRGLFEKVVRNIEQFHEIRARHYPGSRTISRISGVQVPEASTAEEMRRFWGRRVDQVALVKHNPWENVYGLQPNGVRRPCSDLWRRMFVWWDGTINPCDVDYKSMLTVGNACRGSLADAWAGERYARLREIHASRERFQLGPCDRCVFV